MFLKASTDYGLRALLYLAKRNCICSSKEISTNASIPRDYLIQLAQQERNAGLIESHSGKHGGYRIAKPLSEITLLDVINAVNGATGEGLRARREMLGEHPENATIRNMIDVVLVSFDAYLGSITLDMLIEFAHDGEGLNAYLAHCLSRESKRLTQAPAVA